VCDDLGGRNLQLPDMDTSDFGRVDPGEGESCAIRSVLEVHAPCFAPRFRCCLWDWKGE
jgi:hypothetical protein